MKRKQTGLWLSTVLILVMLAGTGCTGAPQTPSAPPETAPAAEETVKVGPFKGMQAPDFTLKDLAGTAWTLSELKGNSVALVFFTSW